MWRGYHVEGYCAARWLAGLGSTLAKVEGIVLKEAWHWGSNSSVVNDPLGEPGSTAYFAGLPSAWGSVDGDCFAVGTASLRTTRGMNE